MHLTNTLFIWLFCCVNLSHLQQGRTLNNTIDQQDNYLVCGNNDDMIQMNDEFKEPGEERRKRSITKREKYLELVLVVDNVFYNKMERNRGRIYKYCQDVVNIVNAVFSQFDLLVVLVDVVIWTSSNPIIITRDTSVTLGNFKGYVFSTLQKAVHHDVAQLLIGTGFAKASGIGTVGGLCSYSAAGVVAFSENPMAVGMVMVHELGHNFGISHNKKGCCEEHCIMDEVIYTTYSEAWSTCSKRKLHQSFSDETLSSCLYNYPRKVFGSGSCGNGILEEGEECDCGLKQACKRSHCCNPDTCKLLDGAACSNGGCCDHRTCQIRSEATLCRSARNKCDLEEYCYGTHSSCPEDVYKQDGLDCHNGQVCVNQKCTARDDHVTCTARCRGNGVCNNKGHCHCMAGLQPPECTKPGQGGSVDSGPMNAYNYGVQIVLYLFFLVGVPLVTALGSVVYMKITHKTTQFKKPKFPHNRR